MKGKELLLIRERSGLTQPQMAKLLTKRTGVKFRAIDVSRMEAHGRARACNPRSIPQVVVDVLVPSGFVENNDQTAIDRSSSQNNHPEQQVVSEDKDEEDASQNRLTASGSARPQLSSNQDQGVPEMSDSELQNLTNEEKGQLSKIMDAYKDLGLLEAEGKTAADMINGVKSQFSEMRENLFGASTVPSEDYAEQIKALEAQKAKYQEQIVQEALKIERGLSDLTNRLPKEPELRKALEEFAGRKGMTIDEFLDKLSDSVSSSLLSGSRFPDAQQS